MSDVAPLDNLVHRGVEVTDATAESRGLSIFKTANQRNNMGVSAEGVLTDALNTILIGAICSPTTER